MPYDEAQGYPPRIPRSNRPPIGDVDPEEYDMEGYLRANRPRDRRPVYDYRPPAPREYEWVREDGYGSPAFGGVIIGLVQIVIAIVQLIALGFRRVRGPHAK